jgi:hypothetical protein
MLVLAPEDAAGPKMPAGVYFPASLRGDQKMADTIREKIQNAGQAAKDAADKAGRKAKDGADAAADKAAELAKSTGQAVKNAGQKIKDKSGA